MTKEDRELANRLSMTKLEETIFDWGVWPGEETKAKLDYSSCVRHMRNKINGHKAPKWWERPLWATVFAGFFLLYGSFIGHMMTITSDQREEREERKKCTELIQLWKGAVETKYIGGSCWKRNKLAGPWEKLYLP